MQLTDNQFDELQNKLENIPPDDISKTYTGKTLAGVEIVADDIEGKHISGILLYFTDNEDNKQILTLSVDVPPYTGLECPPLVFGTARLTAHEARTNSERTPRNEQRANKEDLRKVTK